MIKINNLLQIDEDLSSLLKFVYLRGSQTSLGQVGFTVRNIHTRRIKATITGGAGIQFIPSRFELNPGQARTILLDVSDVAFLETLPVGTTSVDFKVAVQEILPPVIPLPEPVLPGTPPPPPMVLGCTDPRATNYNSSATMNDGSCEYAPIAPAPVRGCTDRFAPNYNPLATLDDGSCIPTGVPPEDRPLDVFGCTDPDATNYNPSATINQGCTYPQKVQGCTDPRATNYNPSAEIDDGSCIGYGEWVLVEVQSAYQTKETIVTQIVNENFQEASADNNFTEGYYYTEYGYNQLTRYGPLQEYQLRGDIRSAGPRPTDPPRDVSTDRGQVFIIVNRFLRGPDIVFATCNEIGKVTQEVIYPLDSSKAGYKNVCKLIQNPFSPGGCLEACNDEFMGVVGCTNRKAKNYNSLATIDDGSCVFPVLGCTDPIALNYSPSAEINDGTCIYATTSSPTPPGGTTLEEEPVDRTIPDFQNGDGSVEPTGEDVRES